MVIAVLDIAAVVYVGVIACSAVIVLHVCGLKIVDGNGFIVISVHYNVLTADLTYRTVLEVCEVFVSAGERAGKGFAPVARGSNIVCIGITCLICGIRVVRIVFIAESHVRNIVAGCAEPC